MIRGRGSNAGQTTMHMTTQEALEHSIARDRAISETNKQSEAALSPQEEMT
jgi:hypothetical protein